MMVLVIILPKRQNHLEHIVIKHEKNEGKGAALKSLFNSVLKTDGDVIVTIDGDGQFLPEEIPKLVIPITGKPCRYSHRI